MSTESRRTAQERRAAAGALRKQQVAQERRRRFLMAGGIVAAVLIVLGVLVGVGLQQKATNTSGPSVLAPAEVLAGVATIPTSVFDAVGNGGEAVVAGATPKVTPLKNVNGKPRILFVGAEWCPYCAAQRWVLAVTLSRFGTFANLGQTESSTTDVYPGTESLSFHGSTYVSQYLDFSPFEVQDNQGAPLDRMPAADQSIFRTYGTGYPFVDIDGKYLSGATIDPGVLHAVPANTSSPSLSRADIIKALKNPDSPIARAVDGSANVLSATICKLTQGQPAAVCNSPGVRAAS